MEAVVRCERVAAEVLDADEHILHFAVGLRPGAVEVGTKEGLAREGFGRSPEWPTPHTLRGSKLPHALGLGLTDRRLIMVALDGWWGRPRRVLGTIGFDEIRRCYITPSRTFGIPELDIWVWLEPGEELRVDVPWRHYKKGRRLADALVEAVRR